MSEYYDEYRSGNGRKRSRRGAVMLLLDVVMTVLAYLAVVAMVLTLCAPYVHPAGSRFFPILGLGAPLTYVATVLLALYWVIRWRWGRAGMLLVCVVAGLFRLGLYYKPEFRRAYETEEYGRDAFKVLSYNIRGFYYPKVGWQEGPIAGLLGEQEPDIICLQEFDHRKAAESEAFSQLAGRYRMTLGNRTEEQNRAERGSQQAILSRYRILRSGTIIPRTSIWADLLVGEDTVRVFNNHLHSTEITVYDAKYLTTHRYVSDTAREEKIRSILSRLCRNSVLRAEQVDTIRSVMAATPYRMIVCGDFNDTPMSYVYRCMARGLTDAFRSCGRGYSYTFQGFFNTLRIDYVLTSDGLEPLSYEVPQVDYSDHLPVVVRLRRNDGND